MALHVSQVQNQYRFPLPNPCSASGRCAGWGSRTGLTSSPIPCHHEYWCDGELVVCERLRGLRVFPVASQSVPFASDVPMCHAILSAQMDKNSIATTPVSNHLPDAFKSSRRFRPQQGPSTTDSLLSAQSIVRTRPPLAFSYSLLSRRSLGGRWVALPSLQR